MRDGAPLRVDPDEVVGVDGLTVMEERVLSVLVLTLVMELMRVAASFSAIVTRP